MDNGVVQKRKISVPVILDFVPTSCSIQINQSADNSVPASIGMGLRLSRRQNLSISDGKDLANDCWGITIYRGATDNERIKAIGAVGLMNYIPATKDYDYSVEEGCSAWAHVDVATEVVPLV